MKMKNSNAVNAIAANCRFFRTGGSRSSYPGARTAIGLIVISLLAGCQTTTPKSPAAKDAAGVVVADSGSKLPSPTLPGMPLAAPPSPATVSAASAPPLAPKTLGDAVEPPQTAKIFPGSGSFVKQAPPAPPAPPSAEEVTFNFEAADIRSIVQYVMGDVLRESFTIDPATSGNATIRFARGVARKDLIPILEMLLRQNGQVMLREDGIYKIMPAAKGTRGSVTPQLATSSNAIQPGFSVQLLQLRFTGVNDMIRILEPYATDPQTSIRKDDLRNILILSGTQRELKHLMDIVDLFDVDYLAGYSVGLFQMSTDVKLLSADLERLFGAGDKSPLAGIVRIIPIERMNGLLVVTTQPKYLGEAKKWIERLDKSGGGTGGMRLNVYAVQHGKAEKLGQLLSEIYGNKQGGTSSPTLAPGQRPAQLTTPPLPGQPGQLPTATQAGAAPSQGVVSFAGGGAGISKDVRIIADSDNNALLILAGPADYETIQVALKQLDVPRRQVKVEVLVAEVTLTDELKFGIEWFIKSRPGVTGALRNRDGSAGGILPSALPRVPAVGNVDVRSVVPTSPGLQLIDVVGGDVRAVLQALGEDGKSQTLSTPNVTVLDNEKATINVGTQISVDTGSTTGGGGVTQTTRQYINTGVILNVTPRINAGGRVTLEINQEISTPGTGTNPNIDTRKAQTVVNVSSGETMVLAGLIQRTRGSASQGVPLLSKIPVLGGLFGTQSYRDNRSELVILITPVVINNSDDSRAVMEELRKKLPSLESYIPKSKPSAPKEVPSGGMQN
jgi:general secretion pathway protein D